MTVCKGSAQQLAFLAVSSLGELSPAQHKTQALQELLYPMAGLTPHHSDSNVCAQQMPSMFT